MIRFKNSFMTEELSALSTTDDNLNAVKLVQAIDDAISSIDTEVELDLRAGKSNSKKIGISQLMDDKSRRNFSQLAREIIEKEPNLELIKISGARAEKDYYFKHKDMEKAIYVNARPKGGRSSLGDDPHELMTAALCLFPKKHTITNSDEMDKMIELVRAQLKKVKGYKQSQVDSLVGSYSNLAQAVSAANVIIDAGYGNADMVYLTGQAWDNDVKQFQMSKYGMQDFNSSDFIIKKDNKFLGVSLKKKKRVTEEDPTLINKSFTKLLNEPKLKKLKEAVEEDAGRFYVHVIKLAQRLRKRYPDMMSDELFDDLNKNPVTTKNWKKYVNRIPNDLINRVLKGKRTLFKMMGETILSKSDLFSNILVQLIFKSDLKELKKVNFDFALVTGVGDYGPKKGVVVEQGEYKDIDSVSSKLDDLFSQGKPIMKYTPGAKQAFDPGSGAANLKFTLFIGPVAVCNIILRYKGNFSSAPNFNAMMTDEFKRLYK